MSGLRTGTERRKGHELLHLTGQVTYYSYEHLTPFFPTFSHLPAFSLVCKSNTEQDEDDSRGGVPNQTADFLRCSVADEGKTGMN